MQSKRRTVVLGFAVSLLVGCTTPRYVLTTPFSAAAPAPLGYALVYIYRMHNDIGSNVWPDLVFGDKKVVGIANLGYSYVYVRPGHYVVRKEKAQAISGDWGPPETVEIPEPKTYYLRLDTGGTKTMTLAMGMYPSPSFKDPYTNLKLVDESQALPQLSACRFIKPFLARVE